MTSQFLDLTTSSIFWRCFVSLVNFSYYWFKSHVNIIAGSEVMTIFFYMGLTRNPEIGNTPVSVLPNIWRLGGVMNTKVGTNVSNRMLLNAAKFQGYVYYNCLLTRLWRYSFIKATWFFGSTLFPECLQSYCNLIPHWLLVFPLNRF